MRGRKFDKLAAGEVFGCIPHGRGACQDFIPARESYEDAREEDSER